MAELLHSNLSFSFLFSSLSLPLNYSPHRPFSFIRFSSLNRRLSLPPSLLAKLSSDSSQFHIISRTENSDGSVSFKFGDVTEVSPTVDGGNEVDLASHQSDVVADNESDGIKEEFVTNGIELKEIVGDALNDGSTSTAKVEISSDSVEDDAVNNGSTSTAEVENSSDSVEDDAVKSNSTSSDELKNNSNLTAEVENLSASIKDALNSDSNATATVEVENLGETAEVELNIDLAVAAVVENLSDSVEEVLDYDSMSIAEVENSSDPVKEELHSDSISVAEVENLSDSVEEELDSDSISIAKVANSSDSDTAKYENQIVDNIFPTCDSSVGVMVEKSDQLREDSEEMIDTGKREHDDESYSTGKTSFDVMIEKAVELSKRSAVMGDVDKLEDGGGESTIITETSHSVEERVVGDVNATVMSEQSDAEQILEKEKEDMVGLISKQLEAEPILDQEDEDTVELMSKRTKAEPIIDEDEDSVLLDGVVVLGSNKAALAGRPSVANLDEQLTRDNSDAAHPNVTASGITSTKTSDSLNMEDMSSLAASSPLSLEVQDIITYNPAQNDYDCDDTLVAVHPATSGITLADTSPESLNKEESLAPAMSISSAVASLSHSLEALTGGKDASFVSNNWFGVADGVGQWSFGGVNVGLYAHEFMQNCEQLLKSKSAGSTNVKKLFQQSAAMTQSTGSARVLIAHVANRVLHVANIGDSGFVIVRNGTIFRKSSPMVHEFSFPYAIGLGDDSVEDVEEYHVDLEEGDVIITATDGLFDNLYEQEIASIVSKSVEAGMHLQDLAELLASKAQEVGRSESARSPFADAAQAAGHPEFIGGKFDHVTVIVSLVQR